MRADQVNEVSKYIPRLLYSLVFYLLLPFIFTRLYLRGAKTPAYRLRWLERLGIYSLPKLEGSVWIHAVSVGEVLAAESLVKQILENHPEKSVVVTTMTPTGSDRVKALMGNRVTHVYAPYDIPGAVSRFYRWAKPQLVIIVETELWPNIIHQAFKKTVPLIVVNARLSEKSMKGYQRAGILARDMLKKIAQVAVQGEADKNRFINLGMSGEKLDITGSVKFDINVDEYLKKEAQILQTQWQGRPCVLAASTHAGEDEQVLQAFDLLRKEFNQALLILVPRHPERFNAVADLLEQRGFKYCRKSSGDIIKSDTQVLLGDTMGELLMLISASDGVFVGGSLVNAGGHNVLEPIALGKPAVTGPFVFNFQSICDSLFKEKGLAKVKSPTELAEVWIDWLKVKPEQQIENASRFLLQNRGASGKQYELISRFL